MGASTHVQMPGTNAQLPAAAAAAAAAPDAAAARSRAGRGDATAVGSTFDYDAVIVLEAGSQPWEAYSSLKRD